MKIGLLTFRRDAQHAGSTAHYIYKALSGHPKNSVVHLAADQASQLAGVDVRSRVLRKANHIISHALPGKRAHVKSKAERVYIRAAVAEAEAVGCDVILGCFCAHESDLLQATAIPIAYVTDITAIQGDAVDIVAGSLKMERERLMVSISSCLLLPSKFVADSAIRDCGADPARTHVVEWGGADIPDCELSFDGLQRASDPFELLFIGHQRHRKGLDRAIRAVETLNEEGIRVRLRIIGRDAEKFRGSDHVEDLGHLDLNCASQRRCFEEAFARATCLIHPARAEPYGHVLVEACARSLPVVCTSVGGMAQIIRSEVNGLVIPEPFVQASLDEAVRRLVMSPELVSELGEGALLESQNRLNWSRWLEQVQPILESISVQGPS